MAERVVDDPEGLARRVAEYVQWLRFSHFSEATARERDEKLRHLLGWLADRGITRPVDVTRPVLERYQQHLFQYRKKDGRPLSLSSQRNYLTSAKGFFKWLARANLILHNPASELVIPKLQKRLPKHVLTREEAERVIAVADVETLLGLRDRAILETLYSTGLRRMELVALRLYDLDVDRGTIMVREGKGRRQRMIPIGERAVAWIEKYLHEARPRLVVPPDEGYIFVTHGGGPFTVDSLTDLVRDYVKASGIGKPGAVHLFRHTMATLMLEGGADIRFIQAMLGHSKLETTEIYTQVSIKKLKEVHTMAHPAKAPAKPLRNDATAERPQYVKGAGRTWARKRAGNEPVEGET